jgi:hypothetical protein
VHNRSKWGLLLEKGSIFKTILEQRTCFFFDIDYGASWQIFTELFNYQFLLKTIRKMV